MSKSFIESYTDTPWERLTYAGFDPDLHSSGLAVIEITKKRSTGQVELHDVKLFSIKVGIKYKQLQAVQEMVKRILEVVKVLPKLDRLLIESQQLYPDKNDTRQSLVGKGNDLIMLATVSGAVAGSLGASEKISIKLPASWKAQKKKDPMHMRAARIVEQSGAPVHLEGRQVHEATTAGGHCMDALCMALIEAGYRL